MKLTHEIVSLRTKHAFTIARGGGSEYRVNLVKITDNDGAEGVGEANPSRYYGENPDTTAVVLEQFATILDKADAWSLDAIEVEMNKMWRRNGSAKSAVMSALYDLMGKRLGVPLYKMWGLDPDAAPLTSFTIGVAPEAELRTKVQEAAEYPLLKVKLGTPDDEDIIRVIREEAPDKILRVDANAGWTPKQALDMIALLAEYDV
ncbi:MAG: hypothetical protein JWO39_3179, partial [Gemmatimonadetes bacterium]|nr:hypothetical protein [Gemmatimonadota bacterium]